MPRSFRLLQQTVLVTFATLRISSPRNCLHSIFINLRYQRPSRRAEVSIVPQQQEAGISSVQKQGARPATCRRYLLSPDGTCTLRQRYVSTIFRRSAHPTSITERRR